MGNKLSYEELEQKVTFLETNLRQLAHLKLFFDYSSDGLFFMMLDKPVHWNESVDKEATLDYIFAHEQVTHINQAMLTQNNLSKERGSELTPQEIYKDNLEQGRQLWKNMLDNGTWELEREMMMFHTSKPIIVMCKYQVIYDEQERVCGHFGIHRDITNEKSREKELMLSEAKYRTLFEESPIGVTIIDKNDRKAIEYNEKAAEIVGYEKEEFGKLELLDYIKGTPESFQKVIAKVEDTPTYTFEQETIRKDGSIGHMLVTIKKLELMEREYIFSLRVDIAAQKYFENQLKTFFSVSADLLAVADWKGYFIKINNSWHKTLGYTHEELKGEPFITFVHPDDRAATKAEVAKILRGEDTVLFINRYRHQKGHYIWLEWTATANLSEQVVYSSARDITNEVLTKQRLAIGEAKYRTLFEQSPTAIVLFDPQTFLPIEFSDRVFHMLQYSREEFAQMSLYEYAIDNRDDIKKKSTDIRTQHSLEFEAKVKCKHGNIRVIQVNVKLLKLADKEVFFNIWTDITAKKQAEQELAVNEAKYRTLFEDSPVGVLLLDAGDWYPLEFNDKVIEILGYSRDEFDRMPISKYLIDYPYLGKEEEMTCLLKTHGELTFEARICAKSKQVKIILVKIKYIQLANREIFFNIWTDITEKKLADEEIRSREERFRSAINSSLDAFYILDALYDEQGTLIDFTFADMNQVGLEAINLPKEEIFGEKLCDILPVNQDQGFFEKYKQVFLTGKTLDEEVVIETQQLTFTWIHHTVVKMENGIAITTRDVSRRKQYEETLNQLNEDLQHRNTELLSKEELLSLANEELLAQQEQMERLLVEITESEQKFRSLAENIKDVFWIRKGDKIEYISPAYEQIWQRRVETLNIGDEVFLDAMPPEDQERMKKVIEEDGYRKQGYLNEEYRVVRPDGTVRWISSRIFPVEINENTFHVVGIAKDVTDRKVAAVKLQELNIKLARQNQELITQEEELRLTNEELKANKETLEDALEKLGISENNLKALFDSSEQAIILLDTEFKVVAFNRAVADFHTDKLDKPLKVGKSILDSYFDNPYMRDAYKEKFEQCLLGKVLSFERQLNYPDFTNIRWVETTLFPVRNHFDRIIGLSFNEKDITEQRNIELKLRKSEVHLWGVMNNTVQSFFLLDRNMRVLLYNTAAAKYIKQAFGMTLKKGESFLNFTPESMHKTFESRFQSALRGKRVSNERKVVYQDGSEAWFDVNYAPIKNIEEESEMVIFSTLNITQRKQAQEREKQLLQAQINYQLEQERLKRAAILEGQERESHRISRELHDGVGQMLSALSYQLNHLETTLKGKQENEVAPNYNQQVRQTTERAKGLLKEVIQEIREISHNLMPKILTDYGLIEALKQLRLDFASGENIPINLDIFCESERFDDNIEISIFRITQEAVNNILKYAQASEVNVQLIEHETNLQLLVEDNGVGFDLEKAKRKNTNGLINMEERARLVNGSLSIDTVLGKGTCIMVEIPLKSFGNDI